ncbi:MAB_1171c family putative transporter [Nocardia brasiliensis]|uniref:MAB_1171c family putative transporter n=1 Tax=Nocardia brasiliensis TaxID=37326 RepID=UPI0033E5CAAD
MTPMTSPLPALIALPVIAIVCVLTVCRWMLLEHTPVDRLINRSLAWAVLGLLLHERGVAPDIASLMHQLSLGCILFTLSGVYGIAQTWRGADPDTVGARQRRYDLATAGMFAMVLVAGTPARQQNLLIDQAVGWPAIVFWALFGAPLAVCAVLILQTGVREFRVEALGLREKLVYYGVFAAAGGLLIDAVAGPVVAALSTYTDIVPQDPQMRRKAATFFAATITAAIITAVPLFGQVSARAGWDRTTHYSRRLQPIWSDLTTAFPGLMLYSADQLAGLDPVSRLHRMTIEIRDGLLNLRPYTSVTAAACERILSSGAAVGIRKPVSAYEISVAHALRAKNSGVQPDPVVARTAPRAPTTSGDLDSELQLLLELADRWSHAKAIVAATTVAASTEQGAPVD